MEYLIAILGFMGYVFLVTVFYNILCITWKDPDNPQDKQACTVLSVVFPLTIAIGICWLIGYIPYKLANVITNPNKFKFKIKIEKKEDK